MIWTMKKLYICCSSRDSGSKSGYDDLQLIFGVGVYTEGRVKIFQAFTDNPSDERERSNPWLEANGVGLAKFHLIDPLLIFGAGVYTGNRVNTSIPHCLLALQCYSMKETRYYAGC